MFKVGKIFQYLNIWWRCSRWAKYFHISIFGGDVQSGQIISTFDVDGDVQGRQNISIFDGGGDFQGGQNIFFLSRCLTW